jgi:NTE family protein
MTLSTLINAGLSRPSHPRTALVLMGGGARTAYQAGALQALAEMVRLQTPAQMAGATVDISLGAGSVVPSGAERAAPAFPFQILVGTSAGALNASFLAARATQGLDAMDMLAQFWISLRSQQVYSLQVSPWVRMSKIAAAWTLSKQVRGHGALLNNTPLVDTLHKAIGLQGIEAALEQKALYALAVTASSYSSGVHWTFCHTARDHREPPWVRPGRRAEFGPINIEHLMASSAIPLIFPATPLWVDGGREYFGDGSMRQTSPLSPAMHLGAHKVLCIGVGQPQRSTFGGSAAKIAKTNAVGAQEPGLGGILGHAMASVFHDTLHGDVEQAQRMNATLDQLPREVAAVMPYRSVRVMSLQPSESLDDIALRHVGELPASARNALEGLGALEPAGAALVSASTSSAGMHTSSAGNPTSSAGAASLASYLLFEPGFVGALIELGRRDAYAQKTQLLEFLAS